MFLIGLFAVSLFLGGQTESTSVCEENSSAPVACQNLLDVYYFYGQGCPHCAGVEPFLVEMEQKYSLQLHKFDVYGNRSLLSVFEEYCNEFNLPLEHRAVPTVSVSDSFFVGESAILEGLEEAVKKALQNGSTSDVRLLEVGEQESPRLMTVPAVNSPSIFTLTVVALVDAISPCSIAILVFLIGARVLSTNRRKRTLSVGLAFCLSVFIAYTLFGFGLLTAVQVGGLSQTFSILVGFLAVLAGFFFLKDVFWYGGGGFTTEVPRSSRPLLMKMLKGVTSPFGAFAMGFVAVCFELPCTGGPYLFILGQMSNSTTKLQAIPVLLYYNFIYILPLIIISLLLFSNFSSISKIREWNENNKRLLRSISAFAMIALGSLVIPVSLILQPILVFLEIFRTVGPAILTIMSIYLLRGCVKRKHLGTRLKPYGSVFLLLFPLVTMMIFVPGLPYARGYLVPKESSVSQITAEVKGVDAPGTPLDSLVHEGLNSGKRVFLFFYLDGCGWCKMQKPVIDQLEQSYSGSVVFLRVNSKENAEALAEFEVEGFPAMFLISSENETGYVYESFRGFTEFDRLDMALASEVPLKPITEEQYESQVCGSSMEKQTLQIAENSDRGNETDQYLATTQVYPNVDLDQNLLNPDAASASCVVPYDDMLINEDTTLCAGEYNLADHGQEGVIIINSDNVKLDCSNAVLNGDGTGVAIYNNGHPDVTIANCKISHFSTAIDLRNLVNNILNNNFLEDNHGAGIYLYSASNCLIEFNTVRYSNTGIALYSSHSLQLISNEACSCTEYDIAAHDSDGFGQQNRCDVTLLWNDDGATGCTNACEICDDYDVDGICDDEDNCPYTENADQADFDSDGKGDVCDNCPSIANSNQLDSDLDTYGDECDNCPDYYNRDQDNGDGDKYGNACDNCPSVSNPGQENSDGDKYGNACDNCPFDTNGDQLNADGDSWGNACDKCPNLHEDVQLDDDNDGVGNLCDNCPFAANKGQTDSDGDKRGDVCDNCWSGADNKRLDTDGDCEVLKQSDEYWDGTKWLKDPHCGDVCDNCQGIANPGQEDWDNDKVGDACDCNDNIMGPNEQGADCGGICTQKCPSDGIPVVKSGSTTGKIDIVFMPANDYTDYPSMGMERFREDMSHFIFWVIYGDPVMYANRKKINFWYTTKIATMSPVVYSSPCNWIEPSGWRGVLPASTIGIILHQKNCRDHGGQGNVFSAWSACDRSVLHELGHLLFKLSDEYSDAIASPPCQTEYKCPDHEKCNVFASEKECIDHSTNPTKCSKFTTCGNGWWKSGPTFTMMGRYCAAGDECTSCGWSPDAERQVKEVFKLYVDPPPDEMKKAIVGYFYYDGESIEMYDYAIVYGDSPERFYDWEDLRFVFLNSRGEVINEFDLRDPRYRDYVNPVGAELMDEVDFSLVFPFIDNLKTLQVYDGATGNLLATIDLSEAIKEFCNEHQDDPQCLSVEKDSTKIWLDPSETSVRNGSTFTINVNVANVTDLYSWQVAIYYENAILEATDIAEGQFLKTGGPTTWFPPQIVNGYNATHGWIMANCTLLGDLPGVNGNGALAAITFRAKASGAAILKIDPDDTLIMDRNAGFMFFEAMDGHVSVVSGATWDLNNDGEVDIKDLVIAGIALWSYPGHPRWNPIADVNQDDKVNIIDLALIVCNST